MNFHPHPTNNMLLLPPEGMTDCEKLPATMCVEDGQFKWIASFWKPTADELRTLRDGGSVVLYIFSQAHPPVSIGVQPE